MPKSGLNVALKGLDDIFSTEESRQEEQREQVQQIPVSELFPFKNHPFKVLDDDSMTRTVESISQFGVLAPLIARPRPEGGYEIISGHRRKHAAELANLDTVPVIVRNIYNLAFLLSDGYKRTYSSYISDIPVPFRLMSVQELTQYDMIAFCGGNAHTLLSEINRTGFSKPLKQAIENGLVYLGISAGSMIAAGNFSDGLGYLANPLIPHAEKESPFGDISKNDLIELADGQTVLIKGNRQEII